MIDAKIKLIHANIEAAKEHLLEIEAAMALLERAGMYPAVPHFQWQSRPGSEGRYLYCIFRQNGDGSYTGPDGKKKLYIGTNEANINEARRLTNNRAEWERFREHKLQLLVWINDCDGQLVALEREADRILEASWKQYNLPRVPVKDKE